MSRGLTWDNYVKPMLRYLEKFSHPIGKPMDVVTMFSGLNNSEKRHLVNGLRNLFNFYEAQGYAEKRWLDLLRRNLPKTTIGVDLQVPSEEEIVDSVKRVAERDAGKRFLGLYNLLLDSGLRLTEEMEKWKTGKMLPINNIGKLTVLCANIQNKTDIRMCRARNIHPDFNIMFKMSNAATNQIRMAATVLTCNSTTFTYRCQLRYFSCVSCFSFYGLWKKLAHKRI